ncbi:hemolysin family protein [cf. Phormidesmis sp. LEGE 11477]|uniref:hemolysin family protein n=1 Tax=cf. Phormidesmis sp. LEGE 11477 TaxID=1828680 RepID=UPI00351CF73E
MLLQSQLLQIQPLLTGTEVAVRLLSVVALILLNAFFVTVEFSIVSARRSRINQLASSGDMQARTVQKLQQKLNSLLSTTQLGITLSSLALGWIGEHTMAALIIHWLTRLPIQTSLAQFLSHSIALPLAFLLLAYLQIVLGELCPKSVALSYPEHIARFLGPPSLTIARLLKPFVWLLNQSTSFLLSILGIKDNSTRWHSGVTPEELRLLINTSTEVPALKKGEREILSNVFEFRGATVEEVMVPRTQIAALPQSATFQDLLDEIVRSKHSRYPMTGESLDNILGIINFHKLALPLSRGELLPHSSVEAWITPAKVVPETLPLNDLLTQMQQSAREMVIVVDEYGGTAGLVTFRDLTAKIIGDATDTDSIGKILYQDSHTVIFPAQTEIEDVNERLSLTLPTSENYVTLGGFVIFELQKIPQINEQLIYKDLELTVAAAEGPKLTKIKIRRLGKALVLSNVGAPAAVRTATNRLL